MRKNIFRSGETNSASLELVLEKEKFILKRNNNQTGRTYTLKGAYDLVVLINKEKTRGNYNGKFTINVDAAKKLKEYESQRYEFQKTYSKIIKSS